MACAAAIYEHGPGHAHISSPLSVDFSLFIAFFTFANVPAGQPALPLLPPSFFFAIDPERMREREKESDCREKERPMT